MDHITPVKAIRNKCIDCCCGSKSEVKFCEACDCPIWPFRFGKNPFRAKRKFTDEQRKSAAERLKAAQNIKISRNY